MEKKQYQLMCTYLKGKYFISTIYRQSSAMVEDCWYFETMAWNWDEKTHYVLYTMLAVVRIKP